MPQFQLVIFSNVFNEEANIGEFIKSVRAQTFQNWILFIGDNYSSDNTVELVKDFQLIDKRIVLWEFDKRVGVFESFWRTAKKATEEFDAEFYLHVGGDDVLQGSGYLEKLVTSACNVDSVLNNIQNIFWLDGKVPVLARVKTSKIARNLAPWRLPETNHIMFNLLRREMMHKLIRELSSNKIPMYSQEFWIAFIVLSSTTKHLFESPFVLGNNFLEKRPRVKTDTQLLITQDRGIEKKFDTYYDPEKTIELKQQKFSLDFRYQFSLIVKRSQEMRYLSRDIQIRFCFSATLNFALMLCDIVKNRFAKLGVLRNV